MNDHNLATVRRLLALTVIVFLCVIIAFATVQRDGWPIDQYDSYAHVGSFAVMTVLALIAYPCAKLSQIGVSLCILAATTELLQFIPIANRQPDWSDFGFNLVGIGGTLALVLLFRKLARH